MTTLFLVQAVTLFSLPVQLCVFAFNLAVIKVIKLMTIRWAGRMQVWLGKEGHTGFML